MGAFGIEIPDEVINEAAPEVENTESADTIEVNEGDGPKTPVEMTDLGKLERFLYEGKEWTPKDLKNAILMREDYTRKTQELSKARESVETNRKYADNLHYDLQKVIDNPALMAEFKKIYPKQFHNVADRLLEKYSGPQTSQNSTHQAPTQLPREIMDRLNKIDEIGEKLSASENKAKEAEIQAVQQQLDGYFDKLSQKYEMADPDIVNSRAIALLERAKQDGSELRITEQLLEKLFKEHQAQVEAKYTGFYETKIKSQKTASLKARDTGRGGEAPTSPPEKLTMKQAKQKLFADLER